MKTMKLEQKSVIYALSWKPKDLGDVPFEDIVDVCSSLCTRNGHSHIPLPTDTRGFIYAKVVEITQSAIILSLNAKDVDVCMPALNELMLKINRVISLYKDYQLCEKIEERANAREERGKHAE